MGWSWEVYQASLPPLQELPNCSSRKGCIGKVGRVLLEKFAWGKTVLVCLLPSERLHSCTRGVFLRPLSRLFEVDEGLEPNIYITLAAT